MSGNHSMIICSEEQFKVLSLPQLRVKHKEKLTATDGSKVRKLGVITLNNKQGRSQVWTSHYFLVSGMHATALYSSFTQLMVSIMKIYSKQVILTPSLLKLQLARNRNFQVNIKSVIK